MLIPARLAFNAEGVPFSERFGDVYHSSGGGPEQARHVFLGGNNLPERWRNRESFTVIETGFGLGLNFLATWQAWREDPRACPRLHYLSVEKHPFDIESLAAGHARWPGLESLARELRARWPVLVPGLHRLDFDHGRLSLTLAFGDAETLVPKLVARADAFYLDGFSPARNPAMWSPELCRRLARLATPGATLATWSVAASVRAALGEAGFAVERRPGFDRKREMLAGTYSGPKNSEPSVPPSERSAVVIGAGIAGCATAERLAARGWEVALVDRHSAPAREASGNRAGALHPMLSRDDNLASRLSRACYLHALRQLADLSSLPKAPDWSPCGLLHIARDERHESLQREIVDLHAYPKEYVGFHERGSAGELAGQPVSWGGWWFPCGGWIHPPSYCEALLARAGPRIHARFGLTADRLEQTGRGWRVCDSAGVPIAEAPIVVLANACDAETLLPGAGWRLRKVRGQVTYLAGSALPRLRAVICGDGYVTPPSGGLACVGATFDFDDDDASARPEDHESNLSRLSRLLPGTSGPPDSRLLSGRVGFRTATADRRPIAGPVHEPSRISDGLRGLREVERMPGLHALIGLGARGLVWAALCAELLAARLECEPLPVECDLADALDPARFALRSARRGGRARL